MSDILRSNELLLTNQMLTSINGEYVLILQADGNMVLYGKVHHEDGSVILDPAWATETIDETAWYAVMQADGNLVLYNREGVTLWQSETDGRPGSFLQLQDDGNLVINGSRTPGWPVAWRMKRKRKRKRKRMKSISMKPSIWPTRPWHGRWRKRWRTTC